MKRTLITDGTSIRDKMWEIKELDAEIKITLFMRDNKGIVISAYVYTE